MRNLQTPYGKYTHKNPDEPQTPHEPQPTRAEGPPPKKRAQGPQASILCPLYQSSSFSLKKCTLWLKKAILPFKIKIIKNHTSLSSQTSDCGQRYPRNLEPAKKLTWWQVFRLGKFKFLKWELGSIGTIWLFDLPLLIDLFLNLTLKGTWGQSSSFCIKWFFLIIK